MNNPLVSILMTAYNREKYIADAIESVLNSTYKNWELIIVDDKSRDNTLQIAKRYERIDSRIRVYVNEKNLGDYYNRNKAASYARGKYIKYIDADDLIYPYGLEQIIFYMEQFPEAGYGLLSLAQDKYKIYPFMLSPEQAYYRHYIQDKWIFHKAPLSAIIKRDVFEKVGGFPTQRFTSDFVMWNILSRYYPVVLMPHGIVWYREHSEQEITEILKHPEIQFKYFKLQYQLLNHPDCPLKDHDKKIAINKTLKYQAHNVLYYLRKTRVKTAIKLFKMSNLNFINFWKYAFSPLPKIHIC